MCSHNQLCTKLRRKIIRRVWEVEIAPCVTQKAKQSLHKSKPGQFRYESDIKQATIKMKNRKRTRRNRDSIIAVTI